MSKIDLNYNSLDTSHDVNDLKKYEDNFAGYYSLCPFGYDKLDLKKIYN